MNSETLVFPVPETPLNKTNATDNITDATDTICRTGNDWLIILLSLV